MSVEKLKKALAQASGKGCNNGCIHTAICGGAHKSFCGSFRTEPPKPEPALRAA